MKKKWKFWLRIAVASVLFGVVLALLQLCLVIRADLDDYTLLGVIQFSAGLALLCFVSAIGLVFASWALASFFRWLFTWRIIKRCLWALLLLAALVPVFYAEENWRGHRAWENYRHELEAKGEKLDFADYVPPRVPDEKNFAFAPVVMTTWSWLLDTNGHKLPEENKRMVRRLDLNLYRTNQLAVPRPSSWQLGQATDLAAWQNYYRTLFVTNRSMGGMPGMPPMPGELAVPTQFNPDDTNEVIEVEALATNEFSVAAQPQTPAADVRLALSKFDAVLEEVREIAKQRLLARFPLNYEPKEFGWYLPHYSALKSCVQALSLRASAELALDKNQSALVDIKLALRLLGCIRMEPGFFSQQTRVSNFNLIMQPIWEGVVGTNWTEQQLAELKNLLAGLDFFRDYNFGMRGELAQRIQAIEYLRTERLKNSITCMCGDTMWWPTLLYRLTPDGWFFLNEKTLGQVFQSALPVADEMRRQIISPAISDRQGRVIFSVRKHILIPSDFALSFTPPMDRFASICAQAQAQLDLARLAIALERYRLANGAYPETLAALAPRFLEKIPRDVINGQPLHYRRTDDPPSRGAGAAGGKFLLYSVGWNETDEGGQPGLGERGNFIPAKGDWVWMFPPN